MITPKNSFDKNEGIKFTTTKAFNLEKNDEKFILKISINEKLIFFELEKANGFPKKDFNIHLSLEELGKINRFFNQFETMPEVLTSLETLLESKNISVVEEEKKMKLKFVNPSNKKEFFIDIPLKEKDLKSEINSINEYISSLNKKVNELEKKVSDLCLFKEEYSDFLKKKKDKSDEKEKDIKNLNNLFKESNIIQNFDEEKLILSWLSTKYIKTNLLFNSKNDGDLLTTFFNKVANKFPTLIIIKTTNNYIFGGYASIAWKCDGIWYSDKNSFIFSFYTKQKYGVKDSSSPIFGRYDLVQFGNDIRIYDKCTSNNQNCVGKVYYNSPDNYQINGGNQYFTVSSYEVYEII